MPEYIFFTLAGDYPEIPQPVQHPIMRWIRPLRKSLQEIDADFRTIAEDPRVKGVVLHLRPFEMATGKLDTIRQMIIELRAAGKRVITWSYFYDTATYYVACAADEIYLTPGGQVSPLGSHRNYLYFADALDKIGLKTDILQISPYKSAGDMFSRSEMSAEVREMANWLADSAFDEFIKAIALGRSVEKDVVKDFVDETPCTDLKAKDLGFIDGIMNEDNLSSQLGSEDNPARLETWENARRQLFHRRPDKSGRYIAVMSIEGVIVDGYSQRPPVDLPLPIPLVFDARAGDLSVVQTARQVLADKRAAAVVVYVDSRGGSATASEAMRAALSRIATRKPLVIAMGPVAASGGYWVSTSGRTILAQPNTITGSIGVLYGKFYETGLLERLGITQTTISRSESAGFFELNRGYTQDERSRIWEQVERIYGMFLNRVSASRDLDVDSVDAIAGGRVWTGRQALEHGLVDELGGLHQAINKARKISGLSDGSRVRFYYPRKQPIAPLPEPSTALNYGLESLRALNRSAPLCLFPFVWRGK
jgi:protease-4